MNLSILSLIAFASDYIIEVNDGLLNITIAPDNTDDSVFVNAIEINSAPTATPTPTSTPTSTPISTPTPTPTLTPTPTPAPTPTPTPTYRNLVGRVG